MGNVRRDDVDRPHWSSVESGEESGEDARSNVRHVRMSRNRWLTARLQRRKICEVMQGLRSIPHSLSNIWDSMIFEFEIIPIFTVEMHENTTRDEAVCVILFTLLLNFIRYECVSDSKTSVLCLKRNKWTCYHIVELVPRTSIRQGSNWKYSMMTKRAFFQLLCNIECSYPC